jgi:hypothetical protein
VVVAVVEAIEVDPTSARRRMRNLDLVVRKGSVRVPMLLAALMPVASP